MRHRTHPPRMDSHQADAAEQAARCATGKRPACPQRLLLGPAFRRTMAPPAGLLSPMHHLLQPLRPVNEKAGAWVTGIMDSLAARNLVERFFNKIKQCRRVATRYDKLAANYLAFIQLASIRLWTAKSQICAVARKSLVAFRQNLRRDFCEFASWVAGFIGVLSRIIVGPEGAKLSKICRAVSGRYAASITRSIICVSLLFLTEVQAQLPGVPYNFCPPPAQFVPGGGGLSVYVRTVRLFDFGGSCGNAGGAPPPGVHCGGSFASSAGHPMLR